MLIQCTEVLYAFKIDEVAKNNLCLQNLFQIDSIYTSESSMFTCVIQYKFVT